MLAVDKVTQMQFNRHGERMWGAVTSLLDAERTRRAVGSTEQLQARITTLEQQVVDLELKLQDRDDDLAAARAANRELMSQLNRGRDSPPPPEGV
ncbi:MAG: hypothetical protein HOY79_47980 [Streptomyces sp.]|nr:hypothetical protein [Streptomyces sp.]